MKFKSKRGFIQLVAVFIAFALIITAGSLTILASKPNRTRGFEYICQKFPDNAACQGQKSSPTSTPSPCLPQNQQDRINTTPISSNYPLPSLPPCPTPTPETGQPPALLPSPQPPADDEVTCQGLGICPSPKPNTPQPNQ